MSTQFVLQLISTQLKLLIAALLGLITQLASPAMHDLRAQRLLNILGCVACYKVCPREGEPYGCAVIGHVCGMYVHAVCLCLPLACAVHDLAVQIVLVFELFHCWWFQQRCEDVLSNHSCMCVVVYSSGPAVFDVLCFSCVLQLLGVRAFNSRSNRIPDNL
ncbi:hypothetical protein COO60DRAFT_762426 [Scenedesmus sp. NREL 46B-D3]|nr:hypothetical protein COO60DRAFT_762426 [Scenedesmus sp. NREL 46B-D3]